jgi:hypothetical protein
MVKKSLLHVIATGKYDRYIRDLIESANNNFMKDTDLSIIIYTDSKKILSRETQKIIPIKIEHEPWPYPTLKRFHYFELSLDLIEKSDYSFYIDVDSLFRKEISLKELDLENFSGSIANLHPGFYGNPGTPERNQNSTAYIPHGSTNSYYCGGFFGGDSETFIHMIKTIKNRIDQDLEREIIAIWHDESHLNKYFLDYPPRKILGEGFSCAEEFLGSNDYFRDPYIIFIDKSQELKSDKNAK